MSELDSTTTKCSIPALGGGEAKSGEAAVSQKGKFIAVSEEQITLHI